MTILRALFYLPILPFLGIVFAIRSLTKILEPWARMNSLALTSAIPPSESVAIKAQDASAEKSFLMNALRHDHYNGQQFSPA